MIEKWEEAFFEVMDENKDGKISFEEWHKAVISGIVKAQKDGWTDSAFWKRVFKTTKVIIIKSSCLIKFQN